MKKYVITGGPGVGKTTIIKILANRGYTVVPEVARMLIEDNKVRNADFTPADKPKEFQNSVIERQLDLESKAPDSVVFLDRGLIDNYGYCELYSLPVPEALIKNAYNRYDLIFLLDPLPQYKIDESRFEDVETAKAIHKGIADGYKKFGYKIITVPVLPPEERADFIISQLS